MLGLDSKIGKCCLLNSGDVCLNDQFYCTDKVRASFTFYKYAFCSFDPNLCGSSKRTL